MFAVNRGSITFGPRAISLKPLVLGWLVAEIVAFAIVVRLVGFGGAVLLSLAASVVGLLTLRRIGLDATRHVRAALAGSTPPDGALLDGLMEALGALLLILPGFVSDVAGLALASPSLRARLAGWVGSPIGPASPNIRRPVRKTSPDIIDLPPSDWRVVDRAER